ncbi:unnamed protein product [Nesidiocoris tenuis]|uniref:Elongation factor Ts, mitochondrial n=1 Tax=Nesidiocoris tenuis TaxID=355587 RepID=A0A6H5G0G3_9HEMI|nr:unnamed protein product [Nesidiocoris tenuis]
MLRQWSRCFNSASALASSSKSDLAKLRKMTGYTFANCKKALEVNNNDVIKAEKWLKEQAQALGWSKATKLEGRATAQGLIGLALKNNVGVMVEVNCETDFVARNKTFQSLVELVTSSCLKQLVTSRKFGNIQQTLMESSDLKAVEGPESKTLSDHAALAISTLGENISLRRALIVTTPSDLIVTGYTHPSPESHSAKVMTGKYGALIAYNAQSNEPHTHQIAKQLCQHIVGMNPTKIGVVDEDQPAENQDDETVMIHQDFLLDPSTTVGQLLEDNGIKPVSFWRYECGESIVQQQDSGEPTRVSQTA